MTTPCKLQAGLHEYTKVVGDAFIVTSAHFMVDYCLHPNRKHQKQFGNVARVDCF